MRLVLLVFVCVFSSSFPNPLRSFLSLLYNVRDRVGNLKSTEVLAVPPTPEGDLNSIRRRLSTLEGSQGRFDDLTTTVTYHTTILSDYGPSWPKTPTVVKS